MTIMSQHLITRRNLLASACALLVGAPAAARPRINGWPALTTAPTFLIEGSGASVALRAGPVADVLLQVARRFHYEIAPLHDDGDVVGFLRGGVPPGSAHLSGTALVLHPGRFPVGARGGLFPHEVAAVRDILAGCGGAVRWGGDDPRAPQEGAFFIDVRPGNLRGAPAA